MNNSLEGAEGRRKDRQTWRQDRNGPAWGTEKKELKNHEQTQRDLWAPALKSAYTLWESQQDWRQRGEETTWRNNYWKHPRCDERHAGKHLRSTKRVKSKEDTETHSETRYNQTFRKQRENRESSKREETHHIPGILSKIICRFFIRNFGQNALRRKTCQPRILYPAKLCCKVREKPRHCQTSKSCRSQWPLDLSCKNRSQESDRHREAVRKVRFQAGLTRDQL